MIPDKKLDFWIQNKYNVILRGKHGVGKTACIKQAFERNGLKWLYFSASTMDPWVDFIGVPKEKEENGKTYLDLVRPKAFAEDEVEALFFDEFNRSAPKIRNAVMELIQFKSINGKKFNNLKIVWAAINPDEKTDDGAELEYNVEPIDPAQLDRFHVIYDVPYNLDRKYFRDKYSEKIASAAYNWWADLTPELKKQVSPRRMDYAMDFYVNKGDLRDVLPKGANVQKLLHEIQNGSYAEQLKAVYLTNDLNKMKEFINNENNFQNCEKLLISDSAYRDSFMPLLESEKVSKMMASNSKILEYIIKNESKFTELIKDTITSNINTKLAKKLKNHTSVWKTNISPINGKSQPSGTVNFVTNFDTYINLYDVNNTRWGHTMSINPGSDGAITAALSNYYSSSQLTYNKRTCIDALLNDTGFGLKESTIASILTFIFNEIESMQQSTVDKLALKSNGLKDLIVICFKILKNVNPNDYNSYIGIMEHSVKIRKALQIK